MSTVPEVILARRFGLRVCAMSMLTNLAAGMKGSSPSHDETKAVAARGARGHAARRPQLRGEAVTMADRDLALRALKLLDLTDLSDGCREDHVEALIQKALTPHGPVAAVCVWPQFVSLARARLKGKGVKVATVINFPAGGDDVERAIEDTEEALDDGADEIDLVLPYKALIAGDEITPADGGRGAGSVGGRGPQAQGHPGDWDAARHGHGAQRGRPRHRLRRALHQDVHGQDARVGDARGRGRDAGGDPRGGAARRPQAVRRDPHAVGRRPLSRPRGRRDGAGLGRPATFRFGASGLYDALLAAIEGRPAAPAAKGPY